MKVDRYIPILACAAVIAFMACDGEQEASAQAVPVEALRAAEGEGEFREARLSSTSSSPGKVTFEPGKPVGPNPRLRANPLPTQCEGDEQGGISAKGRVRIELFSLMPEGVQIYEGERVFLKIENLGESRFEGGTLGAGFSLSETQAQVWSQSDYLRRAGFGWGRFDAAPENGAYYSGALFVRLNGGESVIRSPEVATSCDRRFPYDANMYSLTMSWNTLCREGKSDGGFGVKLWAKNSAGKKRVLSEVIFNACTLEVGSPEKGGDMLFSTASSMPYGLGTPPRGRASRSVEDGWVTVF